MKLIIDIPDNIYEWVWNTGKFGMYRFDTAKAIKNGMPLDSVKAEIKEKCDNINYVTSHLSYPTHRFIQELLCEILASIDNAESEGEAE